MARIPVAPQHMKGVFQRVQEANTPPGFRAKRTKLPKTVPTDTVKLSKADTIKPEEIKLYPKTPSAEDHPLSIKQEGPTMLTLNVLFGSHKAEAKTVIAKVANLARNGAYNVS